MTSVHEMVVASHHSPNKFLMNPWRWQSILKLIFRGFLNQVYRRTGWNGERAKQRTNSRRSGRSSRTWQDRRSSENHDPHYYQSSGGYVNSWSHTAAGCRCSWDRGKDNLQVFPREVRMITFGPYARASRWSMATLAKCNRGMFYYRLLREIIKFISKK